MSESVLEGGPCYDAMPAGRELDALVAEKVMGRAVRWARDNERDGGLRWADERQDDGCPTCGYDALWRMQGVPLYSTDIAAAWEVVEKTRMFRSIPDGVDGDSGLSLRGADNGEWEIAYRQGIPIVRAPTAPLAICIAALIAVHPPAR